VAGGREIFKQETHRVGSPKKSRALGFWWGALVRWCAGGQKAGRKEFFCLPAPKGKPGSIRSIPWACVHASTPSLGVFPSGGQPRRYLDTYVDLRPPFRLHFGIQRHPGASLERLVPPCSVYPTIDWAAASRSGCRHPCLSFPTPAYRFISAPARPDLDGREGGETEVYAKKVGIPEKKRLPLRLAHLVVHPLLPIQPVFFLLRLLLSLPRLLSGRSAQRVSKE